MAQLTLSTDVGGGRKVRHDALNEFTPQAKMHDSLLGFYYYFFK